MSQNVQHAKELQQIEQAAAYFRPANAFIAGGALTSAFTGQPINDVDFYFKSKEAFMEAVAHAYSDGLWCVAATDRAVTFISNTDVIQLMHFDFFETAEAIFDAFDYTVCMAAYDMDKKEFIFSENFMKHAAQRHLSFHSGTRYPYGSLLRVLKYQDRGYKINKADLLRIGLACSTVPIESWDDLAAAIGGQYGEKALIQEETPFSIDAAIDLYKGSDEIVVRGPSEAMPGCAGALLFKLGLIDEDKQDDYEW